MVLASDGGGSGASPEARAKVVQQMGTLFKGNDFSIVGEMRSSLVELTSPMIEGLCALVPNFSVGVNVGVATTDVEVREICIYDTIYDTNYDTIYDTIYDTCWWYSLFHLEY